MLALTGPSKRLVSIGKKKYKFPPEKVKPSYFENNIVVVILSNIRQILRKPRKYVLIRDLK
jgi:hypothetical protein